MARKPLKGEEVLASENEEIKTEQNEENKTEKNEEEGEGGKEEPKPKLCCSARLIFCFMCFFVLFNLAYVRVGVAMAFVCMVIPSEGSAPSFFGLTGEFNWSSVTKGYLMSALFYGFLVGPFLGGYLSFKFSGKMVMVLGSIGAGASNFFIPEMTRISPAWFFVIRVIMGIFAGFIHPAYYDLVSHWIVPDETQVLVAGVLVSMPLANILNFPIMCLICGFFGWVWLFYTIAVWMILIGIVVCFVIHDHPATCPYISEKELLYLQKHTTKPTKGKIPWKSILTSVPIYSYVIMHFCINYIFLSMILSMPLFLGEAVHVSLEMNGFLSAIPFVGSFTMRIVLGFSFEHLRNRFKMSKNTLRKIMVFLGASLVSVFLFTATILTPAYKYYILGCFTFTMMSLELCMSGGYLLSLLDLCPGYVNIVTGIANTIANSAGLIGPVVNGWITPMGTKEEWNAVFYVDIFFMLLSSTFYLIFGRNSLQSWGRVHPRESVHHSQSRATSMI